MNHRKILRPVGVAVAVLSLVAGTLALTAIGAEAANVALTPVADASVRSDQPTTPIGTVEYVKVKGDSRRAFVKFTVSGVPAGDVVTGATLRLFNLDTATGSVAVSSTANTWGESTLTWNNQPPAGALRDTKTLAPGAGVATDFNVTPAVTANGDVSFVLKGAAGGALLSVGSREALSPANRPQLIVTTKTPPAWGSSIEVRTAGETLRQAMLRTETTMGKGAVRVYGQAPAWPTNLAPLDDRTLVYSFKGASPLQVLSGNLDGAFRQFLTDAKAYVSDPANPTAKVYWSYYHEPEDNIKNGEFTAADYRAAWTHLLAISNEPAFVNVARIQSTLILMKFTLEAGSGRTFTDYYNSGVDVLGWDPYKWDPTVTIPSMFDPIVANAKQFGKPWAIAEVGVSVKHTDAQRLTALHDVAAYLATRNPTPLYVTYFNSDPGGPSVYQWPIDDEPTMANAWKSGQDGN